MSEISERYRRLAAQFTLRVVSVPEDAWGLPSPCEGWLTRDVVRHLVDWLPAFFGRWDMVVPPHPSVDVDPAQAWAAVDGAIQAALDDPGIATLQRDTPMGRRSFESSVDMICAPDILIHTWDLARATGLDETLDADEVHRFVQGMEAVDDLMRRSGEFGPRIPVPDDADEQTRLIGFVGRHP